MAIETQKLSALRTLAGALPVANAQVAAQQKAARDMQLQAFAQKTPTPAATIPTAQQAGTATAQQAGNEATQRGQEMINTAGQIAAAGQQEQQRAATQQLGQARLAAGNQELDNLTRFERIDAAAKRELVDAQKKFDKDEAGRERMNLVNMSDWARTSANLSQNYESYAQKVEQAGRRKMQVMEHANKLLMADLEQKAALAKQTGDQQLERDIHTMKQQMTERMQREQTRLANSQAAWAAGGTIVGGGAGAAIGALAGNPVLGAQLGAQAGGGVGTSLGSMGG